MSGDSGKTTFMKQIKLMHGGGFSQGERTQYRQRMLQNVFDSILGLIRGAEAEGHAFDQATSAAMLRIKNYVNPFVSQDGLISDYPEITRDIAQDVEAVWREPFVQALFSRSAEARLNIQDTAYYFLERASALADPEYNPTEEDILHVRSPTTAITETIIKIKDFTYHFYDVGGQQKYRKQWTPYFDNVHNIVFLVSLSSFDQSLAEEATINRMHDALDLFDQICNHALLKHIPITLMLNKRDLFEKKFPTAQLGKVFPDYTPMDLKKSVRFIDKKFRSKNQVEGKRIVSHTTCCTDTRAMKVIISSVLDSMVESNLKETGKLALQRSKEIDAQLAKDKEKLARRSREPHLLVLGSGDSGKSTLMRQLKILHGGGYSEDERRSYRRIIQQTIRDSFSALLVQGAGNGANVADPTIKNLIHEILNCFQRSQERDASIPANIGQAITQCWKHSEIQSIYESVGRKVLPDTAYYFLERADFLCDDSRLPTDEDILHIRIPTTQITETIFVINKMHFHFYDVGGQQKYRKQWTPYFDTVNQIMFVVSLASYDQNLVEDLTINRMHDALDLFGQICNHQLLKHIPIILFLNKKDLFEKKIETSPIEAKFPDYKNGPVFKKAVRYFEKKFKNECHEEKEVVAHVTCCTDTKAMAVIIKTCIESLTMLAIKETGLVRG
ncbi:hypothetical protein HK105_203785 [Polyrhizophydium stewartii]|uniref:Uncharacterized protein n=1 Tax=Polyrhizophydium stewartii TaxID=2732419 RepID=A0ABR4NAY1_9FUNG